MDLGVCGVEQFLCIGTVTFDTKEIANGIVIAELPEVLLSQKQSLLWRKRLMLLQRMYLQSEQIKV